MTESGDFGQPHADQSWLHTLADAERALRSVYGPPDVAWTRTILCPPSIEPQVRSAVESFPTAEHFAIRASKFVPEGEVYIVNDQQIDEAMKRARASLFGSDERG